MAPEAINYSVALSLKYDVFSYAMILYELITLQLPFHDISGTKCLIRFIQGKRPSLPEDCLPFLHRLIEDCWAGEPNKRPAFTDIVESLILQQYPLDD